MDVLYTLVVTLLLGTATWHCTAVTDVSLATNGSVHIENSTAANNFSTIDDSVTRSLVEPLLEDVVNTTDSIPGDIDVSYTTEIQMAQAMPEAITVKEDSNVTSLLHTEVVEQVGFKKNVTDVQAAESSFTTVNHALNAEATTAHIQHAGSPTVPTTTSHVTEEAAGSEDYQYNKDYLSGLSHPYEIIYPVQYRKNKPLPLDTREYNSKLPNTHYQHTSVVLTAFGQKMKLRLELNRELLSRGIQQKYHVDKKTVMISESAVEPCYYQGKVRKIADSLVAVSTCYGLSGVIKLHNETYIIQPLKVIQEGNETRNPHVVYKTSSPHQVSYAEDIGQWLKLSDMHKIEFLRKLKFMKTQQEERDFLAETKHLNLALVLDNSVYDGFNKSYTHTVNYAVQLANVLDILYSELRVRIHLVQVEIWNMEAQFTVTSSIKQTLHDYLRHVLLEQHSRHQYHTAQFITRHTFEHNYNGFALPDTVCSDRAVGVNHDDGHILHTAAVLTNTIGVTLGMKSINNSDCGCEDPARCFINMQAMSPAENTNQHFSLCNERDFNSSLLAGLGACMFEPPYDASYSQTCGNRIVERGEECDCGYEEECFLRDPCCDYDLCLLKSWTTCRYGSCCDNCTVVDSSHVCRSALTECDVPEYCDGTHGQCPPNEFVSDGSSCRDSHGYCYKGLCPNHEDQCYALWGEDAESSDDKCYEEFNPTGSFNGHCGRYADDSDSFYPCQLEDIKCGLLHCTKGGDEPFVGVEKTFSRTTVVSEGVEFHCKIVNGYTNVPNEPELGVVEEGTKCGEGRMCLNRTCQPIEILNVTQCPIGINGTVCSMRGLCTTNGNCYCPSPYYGIACEMAHPTPTVAIDTLPHSVTNTIPDSTHTTTHHTPHVDLHDASGVGGGSGVRGGIYSVLQSALQTTASVLPVDVSGSVILEETGANRSESSRDKKPGVTTLWLVIVLASVAGATLLVLLCCMICYRRRSPKRKKMRKAKSKILLSKVLNNSLKSSSCEEIGSRIISFGNMPSYRKEKRKKAALSAASSRKSTGTIGSETGSEHSYSRDSTLLNAQLSSAAALQLGKQPERGILKKQDGGGTPLLRNSAVGGHMILRDGEQMSADSVALQPLMKNSSTPVNRHSGMRGRGAVEHDRNESCASPTHSCCSCHSACSCGSSDCKNSPGDGSDFEHDIFGEDDVKAEFSDEDSDDMNVQGSRRLPPCDCDECDICTEGGDKWVKSGEGDHDDASLDRAMRLKNIDELIRQIDEHVNKLKSRSGGKTGCGSSTCGSGSAGGSGSARRSLSPTHINANGCNKPLSINIPTQSSTARDDLPPYSSPPPPVMPERSPRRTTSPPANHRLSRLAPQQPAPHELQYVPQQPNTIHHGGYEPLYKTSPTGPSHASPYTVHSDSDVPAHFPPTYDCAVSISGGAAGSVSPASTVRLSPRISDRGGEGGVLGGATAVPYRGAQQLSPSTQRATSNYYNTNNSGDDISPSATTVLPLSVAPYPEGHHEPHQPSPRPPRSLLTSSYHRPLLDVVSPTSPNPDAHSTSEGYHSDRHDPDDSIIVREIPRLKSPPQQPVPSAHYPHPSVSSPLSRPKSSVDV